MNNLKEFENMQVFGLSQVHLMHFVNTMCDKIENHISHDKRYISIIYYDQEKREIFDKHNFILDILEIIVDDVYELVIHIEDKEFIAKKLIAIAIDKCEQHVEAHDKKDRFKQKMLKAFSF